MKARPVARYRGSGLKVPCPPHDGGLAPSDDLQTDQGGAWAPSGMPRRSIWRKSRAGGWEGKALRPEAALRSSARQPGVPRDVPSGSARGLLMTELRSGRSAEMKSGLEAGRMQAWPGSAGEGRAAVSRGRPRAARNRTRLARRRPTGRISDDFCFNPMPGFPKSRGSMARTGEGVNAKDGEGKGHAP